VGLEENGEGAGRGRPAALIGSPRRRHEDHRLVTGGGRFIDDLKFPGMLHMAVVRSPLAHARIISVDLSAALALEGVVDAVSAAELPPGMENLNFVHPPRAEVVEAGHPVLARDRVRYVGQPVAAVLARSPQVAADAAALVQMDLESLPAVVDYDLKTQSQTVLHEAAPDNVLMRWSVSSGDVDAAFDSAAHVVRQRVEMPRLAAAPMEGRGSVASYEEATGVLTVWCSSQDQHRPRAQLSRILDIPLERLRVIVPDVGGAFGSKGPVPPETVVSAVLSMRSGHSVKWVEDRQSNLLGSYQGRGMISEAELALDEGGRMLALRARLQADFGAFMILNTATVPLTTAGLLPGPYAIAAADVQVIGMATNKVPTGPYRGAGRPEAAIIIEGLVERAAVELGIDPAELRRRNLIPPGSFPYRTPVGMTYDSGDYEPVLDRALELSQYSTWRRRQREGGTLGPIRLGVGVSASVERSGTGLWEIATVSIEADGAVIVSSGATPTGQGHQTTFAQIAADRLGLDPAQIQVRQGDSFFGPVGVGTFGSRATTVGGSAVFEAATQVRSRLERIASHLLQCENPLYEQGRFFDPASPERGIGLPELAEAAHSPEMLPPDLEPGLTATVRFELPDFVVSFGVYVAVVEIDMETGSIEVLRLVAVDDAGRIVNPLLAEGQVVGGAVQGLGQALLEEVIHDEDGQPMTTSFLDYLLPTAVEVPPMTCDLLQTLSPYNPLGSKGIGEAGSIGTPCALSAAIFDALGGRGSSTLRLPFTLERTWELLRQ